MRLFALLGLLLAGCLSSFAAEPFEFEKIVADVEANGIPTVVNQLSDANPRLAAALRHAQPFLNDDRQQLWFQIQARTRMEGWEDFQQQLRDQMPNETLVALTSKLLPVPSGFEQPTPLPKAPTIRQHAISPDGAWETQFSQRSFTVLQRATGKTAEFTLSETNADMLGPISTIAVNAAQGYVTIGGTKPAVLHYRLKTKETVLVKLEDRDNNGFVDYRVRSRGRVAAPEFRVIVTPDTKHAVMWGQKTVASFNALTGDREFRADAQIRHFGRRYGFLSDERIAINYQAVTRNGPLEGIRIYDLIEGKEAANLEHGAYQVGIAIHEGSDTIVTSGRRHYRAVPNSSQLVAWNATTGKNTTHALMPQYGNVIGISEDGQRILTLSLKGGTIYVWDVQSKQVERRFDLGIDVVRGRLDGSTLVITQQVGRNTIEHWFHYHRAE